MDKKNARRVPSKELITATNEDHLITIDQPVTSFHRMENSGATSTKFDDQPQRAKSPAEIRRNIRVESLLSLEYGNMNISQNGNSVVRRRAPAIMATSQTFQTQSTSFTKVLDLEKIILRNFHIKWNWGNFFEFFLYHFVFFFLLGPFIGLIFWYKPGITLLRNMDFYGNSFVLYLQSFIYITNVYCTVSYYLNYHLNFSELCYLWALVINVCLIISAKYATFSPEIIFIYKTTIIPIASRKKLQYLHFHTPQSVEARYIELYAAFKRNEFEPSLFFLTFFNPPKKDLTEELDKIHTQLKDTHKTSEVFSPNPLIKRQNEQIFGYAAAYKMIEEYDKRSEWVYHAIVAFLISVFMALLSIFYKLYSKIPICQNGYDLFIIILMIISEVYCGFICMIFLFVSLRDFRKKQFLLEQCEKLINPRKNFWNENQLLPKIDITDPQTIMAWTMLRKICFDYGKQYTIRTQAFYSFIIFYCIVASLTLILHIVKVFQIDQFTLLYLSFGLLVFLYLMMCLLIEQAILNTYFEKYRNTIEDWISIVIDVQRMKKFYFDEGIVPYNYLHRKIIEFVCDKIQDAEEASTHLEGVVQGLEDALRHLNQDERNNSFKFYGLRVTFDKLGALVAGIGTVIGIGLDYWIRR